MNPGIVHARSEMAECKRMTGFLLTVFLDLTRLHNVDLRTGS